MLSNVLFRAIFYKAIAKMHPWFVRASEISQWNIVRCLSPFLFRRANLAILLTP